MTTNGRQHALHSIFHPHWTPSVDSQLLALRDQGVPLHRIAVSLMRQPKAVEQRWHRLRVVPGVRERLRRFGADSAEYPVEASPDLTHGSGGAAP
ncbi:hypothetical protein [Sulfitobacter sp.]|uniref:hypothetical protein n=1 Tax=Sulfitobacter sp. TaxID=1903071 RepID=UPI003001EFF1